MKVAVILLSLIVISSSAPQPKKDFHEHFEDFLEVIANEAGHELDLLYQDYMKFEEFQAVMEYVKTANFRDLIFEMEFLPQFQAVVTFLETYNIDITFFLEGFNEILNGISSSSGRARIEPSGTSLSAFIQDSINVFPQEKLASLYDQKMAEDEAFRVAMENLYSDEWNQIFNALWEAPEFQKEVETLRNNGFEVSAVMDEILAVFGQNKSYKM